LLERLLFALWPWRMKMMRTLELSFGNATERGSPSSPREVGEASDVGDPMDCTVESSTDTVDPNDLQLLPRSACEISVDRIELASSPSWSIDRTVLSSSGGAGCMDRTELPRSAWPGIHVFPKSALCSRTVPPNSANAWRGRRSVLPSSAGKS